MVKILPKQKKIIGYSSTIMENENFHNYFVLEFNKDFEVTILGETIGV